MCFKSEDTEAIYVPDLTKSFANVLCKDWYISFCKILWKVTEINYSKIPFKGGCSIGIIEISYNNWENCITVWYNL